MAQLIVRAPMTITKPLEALLKETAIQPKEVGSVTLPEEKPGFIPSVVGATRLTVLMERLSRIDPSYFGSTIRTI